MVDGPREDHYSGGSAGSARCKPRIAKLDRTCSVFVLNATVTITSRYTLPILRWSYFSNRKKKPSYNH